MMDDYPKLAAVLLVLLMLVGVMGPRVDAQNQKTVFENIFIGVTDPVQSGGIINVGQAMHLLRVSFPDETTTIGPLEVQFIWSRDGSNWRPTGLDIVEAPVLSNGVGDTDVAAYRAYYGSFRAIAVRNGLATPGGAEMRVDYYGYVIPSLAFVTLTPDRWIFQ